MLIVNNSGTSNVVVTLYEKCSNLVNPYFTWEIVRKGSNDVVYFTNEDISTSKYYWNEFQITPATSSYGLTQGLIPLIPGEYIYNIWETTNQYDLSLSTAIGIVETGILICGTNVNTIPVYTQNDNNTIPVFKRN